MTARIVKRGEARGQSLLAWMAYTGMQISWLSGAILFVGPAFHTPACLVTAQA